MPKRPPKAWWDAVTSSIRASGSAYDPEAVAGSLWYHKFSKAERRRISRGENPTPETEAFLAGLGARGPPVPQQMFYPSPYAAPQPGAPVPYSIPTHRRGRRAPSSPAGESHAPKRRATLKQLKAARKGMRKVSKTGSARMRKLARAAVRSLNRKIRGRTR